MPIISFKEIDNVKIGPIVRLYISGSSGSGKTYFIANFLKSQQFEFSRVYYFHPDFHECTPINWHTFLPQDVIYRSDVPTVESIKEMKPFSVIVLDDIFDKVESSYDIDYLFRVLSGKLKLHVIVMSQRYFSNGKYSINLRNCCDYHVLMRNSDLGTTKRIARTLGHEKEILSALKFTDNDLYPYIFVDKTHLARVNRAQVYIDILSSVKVIIHGCMKYYLLSEKDFLSSFRKIDKNLALYEDETKTVLKSGDSLSQKNKQPGTASGAATGATGESERSTINQEPFSTSQRRCIETQIKRTLHQFKKRSKL